MNKKKILIVEPHPYHFEVIPGVVKIFENLGYDVTLMVRDNFDEKDIFCRFNDNEKSRIKILRFDDDNLKCRLQDEALHDFEFVFFNSYEFCHDGKDETIINYLGFIPQAQKGFLGIIHNKSLLSKNDLPYIKEGRLFALTPFIYEGEQIEQITSSYYGEFEKKKLNSKIRIVIIGRNNKREILERALKKIKNPSEYFEFIYIGPYGKKEFFYRLYRELKNIFNRSERENTKFYYKGWKQIKCVGKLSFRDMYSEIEKADFILILLDIWGEDAKYFLDGKTTGAKQLSLGFNKPCIVNKKFGKAFGFDNNSAVFYDDNHVEYALDYLRSINNDEYANLIQSLNSFREKLIEISIDNVKKRSM